MDRINQRVDSKFRFVLLAAQRAEQMMKGARPKIESNAVKKARVAMTEILEEAVVWDYGPAPEPEVVEEAPSEAVAPEAPAEGAEGGVN